MSELMDGCWTVRVILPDLGAQLVLGRLRVLYLLTDSLDTGGPNHYRALLPYHVAATHDPRAHGRRTRDRPPRTTRQPNPGVRPESARLPARDPRARRGLM